MKKESSREARNDKIMDILLEEALEYYVQSGMDMPQMRELTPEEEKMMEEMKKPLWDRIQKSIRKEQRVSRRPTIKRCLILVALVAALTALALNVSAFRVFIYKTYTEMSGTMLHIKTEKIPEERYRAVKEFKYKDEIIIPGWLPPGMTLTDVTDSFSNVGLEYQNGDVWMTLNENMILSDSVSTQIQTEKNIFTTHDTKVLDMNGTVVEIENEIGIKLFIVSWSSDNVCYEIFTNGTEDMVNAILQSLKYLQ